MNRIKIRSYEPADIHDVVPLLNRCLPADEMNSEVFQRKVLLDINYNPRGTLVALDGDKVVGFGLGIVRRYPNEDSAPDFDRSYITLLAVDEAYRRQGIGRSILALLDAYFRESKCVGTWVCFYAPNYFSCGIDVNAYPEGLEFFKAMGFAEVMRPQSMDANLVRFSTPDWVNEKEKALQGKVTFEPYRPELILPLLDWMRADFPGDWQRFAREAMTNITLGVARPDSVWIAHEKGKVLGYCQHDNNCRFGPFGVSSAERGRGIGAILLCKILHAMRQKGLHNAWFLWTDDKVGKLYHDAGGFEESRRFALLKKVF